MAVPEVAEVPVDLAPATAPGDDGVDLVLGRRSHPHPEAVIGEHLQPLDVVGGPAALAVETGLQRDLLRLEPSLIGNDAGAGFLERQLVVGFGQLYRFIARVANQEERHRDRY